MSTAADVIVVGAGLSGLMTAWLAHQRGLRVLVVARGVGATHVSAGTIDVLSYGPSGKPVKNPTRSLGRDFNARPQHPYRLAGQAALKRGVSALQEVCAASGYPLVGNLQTNLLLPTAIGAVRPTCLAPCTMSEGHQVGDRAPWLLVGFRDWAEFDASYAAANLGEWVHPIDVELPEDHNPRKLTSTDVARLFEECEFREAIIAQVKRGLRDANRVGFPAVLGQRRAIEVVNNVRQHLGVPVFEIPTMPPCVPGVRLFDTLHTVLRKGGVEIILGPTVTGWVEDGTVQGVVMHGASGPKQMKAGAVVLATGGLLNGGLIAEGTGEVRESVFGIPVEAPPRDDWYKPLFLERQPLLEAGLQVNEQMQPVVKGQVLYKGLYAVGGVLGGADRLGEGSTQGIDLATAAKAVESIVT